MKSFKEFLNERVSQTKATSLIDSDEIINATFNGNYIKLKELLDQGYNPDFKDSDKWTALTVACKYSDKEYLKCVKLLLEHGADVNLTAGANDNTPLAFASNMPSVKSSEFCELLFEYGANPNIRNKAGWTPMHIIARYGFEGLYEMFKEHHADAYIKDNNGQTPMDVAYRNNHKDFVKFFAK